MSNKIWMNLSWLALRLVVSYDHEFIQNWWRLSWLVPHSLRWPLSNDSVGDEWQNIRRQARFSWIVGAIITECNSDPVIIMRVHTEHITDWRGHAHGLNGHKLPVDTPSSLSLSLSLSLSSSLTLFTYTLHSVHSILFSRPTCWMLLCIVTEKRSG